MIWEDLEAFLACLAAFFSLAVLVGFFFDSLLLFCSLLILITPVDGYFHQVNLYSIRPCLLRLSMSLSTAH